MIKTPGSMLLMLLMLLMMSLGSNGRCQTIIQYKNPYDVLHLVAKPSLTDAQVLEAYQARMRENPTNEKVYNHIMDAYSSISTAEKRANFDASPLFPDIDFAGIPIYAAANKIETPPEYSFYDVDDPDYKDGASRGDHVRYIFMNNPLQERWKNSGSSEKLHILQQAQGATLVKVVLSVMIDARPWDEGRQDEMRNLLLKRFKGNRMAFANFMNITIQDTEDLDPNNFLPEVERYIHYRDYAQGDVTMRLMVGYSLIKMLAAQRDYWAGKTLVDLYLGLDPNQNKLQGKLREEIQRALRKRWPKEWGYFKGDTLIFLRRALGPIKFFYRMTCSGLMEGFAWKRVPF